MQDLWGPVELVASPLDDVCRPDARVDVLEDGSLALFVTRIYLLVRCTHVALDLFHLLVLGVLPGSDKDSHGYLRFQALPSELLAVLNLLHVVHGFLHDVPVLQVEGFAKLLDTLDAL